MSDLDQEYYDFYEFQQLLEEITSKLNRATMMQNAMHWQFGEPDWYQKFFDAMKTAKHGWMYSNC